MKEEKFIKKEYRSLYTHNKIRDPSSMQSTNPDRSLTVILDINAEEVESGWKDENGNIHKPKTIAVSLHNPQEPFLITPKVTEIDDSGRDLTESQRNCRLNEDSESLDIFNIYTRTACMFECMRKQAIERCGCIPWDDPVNVNDKE